VVVYRGGLADSSRWDGFVLRPGDIVISTPSKCGTTWMQMICALLVFGTPELPEALTRLSPWLDMRLRPLPEVVRLLEAQRHRRFIKTHTPLDGLPDVEGVHYVVVGRDPLDVAVSMCHHRANLNGAVIDELLGVAPQPSAPESTRRARVLRWIHDEQGLDSLPGLLRHLGGAWERRDDPAVVLVHYRDLRRDLEGQMRGLAARLGFAVAADSWPAIVPAAGWDQMRARADDLVPDERLGLFTDRQAFFRSGTEQQWRTVLTEADLDAYRRRLGALAAPDLIAWL
jgi:aryl sulfotransferase